MSRFFVRFAVMLPMPLVLGLLDLESVRAQAVPAESDAGVPWSGAQTDAASPDAPVSGVAADGAGGAAGEMEPEPVARAPALPPASMGEPSPGAYELAAPILVIGRRPMSAASSSVVRDRDFLLRPHTRPADILQVTPGLYVAQHAGGGKANQYFLRGFDADHGTDVALSVDGVPVNMVSHGHGQGYADLNWLIPEIAQRIEVFKGPYFAQFGDFATAGAINVVTHEELDANRVSVSGGMFNTYRGLVIASPKLADWQPLLAAEIASSDGPFDHGEDLKRFNLFTRVAHDFSSTATVSLTATGYAASWNASGQLPLRAVEAGTLDRFGAVDPSDGGSSQRHSVYARYHAEPTPDSAVDVTGYLVDSRLTLFSNFTFFSRDPEHGDQIEQRDRRVLSGGQASYRFIERAGEIEFATVVGTQLRHDAIDNALYYDQRRQRLETAIDAEIGETSLGLYAQEEVTWTPWLRTIVGARADYFSFDVDDQLEDLETEDTRSSGVESALRASPKATLVLTPAPDTDVYLNFGMGFHSNDARGVVRNVDPVTPLARATGYEIGARTRLLGGLDLALSLFSLDLDSEIVWVGDEGTTEARGKTRRIGAEFEARAALLPWLFADLDVTLNRAIFTDLPSDANAVPLAPELLVSGGLSVRHPGGYYGRVGLFHLGDRPASEDGFFTAQGFTRLDATAGYRAPRYELSVTVANLTNIEWAEAQFQNVSRLMGETAASCPASTRPVVETGTFAGCDDIHFTPGPPIQVQAIASLFF
jgi:outer membrane receptor protein involved in Fe transport